MDTVPRVHFELKETLSVRKVFLPSLFILNCSLASLRDVLPCASQYFSGVVGDKIVSSRLSSLCKQAFIDHPAQISGCCGSRLQSGGHADFPDRRLPALFSGKVDNILHNLYTFFRISGSGHRHVHLSFRSYSCQARMLSSSAQASGFTFPITLPTQ